VRRNRLVKAALVSYRMLTATVLVVVVLVGRGLGCANAQAIGAQIPTTPFISPAAGTYTKGLTLKITDATPDTIIYYTTDGSARTTASPRYATPISIPTESIQETIRAFATLAGVYSSATSSEFTISPQVVAAPEASQLAFIMQPTSTTTGFSIAPSIVVVAEDESGNPVSEPSILGTW
jgi:hypothetical protein